jgi:hypothetical protein
MDIYKLFGFNMDELNKKQINYVKYNKELIQQGAHLIDPAFIDTWTIELSELNKSKVGQPFKYPSSMIKYCAILHAKNFPFRQIQGALLKISQLTTEFPVPSFSQIRRRVLKMKLNFETNTQNLEVAVDGSGMKPATRGDWIRKKWKVKRGWIKVVAMGDTKGNIVDVVVGEETLNEQEVARELIKKHAKKIAVVYLDGLHDTKKTFELCKKNKIKAVIKIRKNASPKGFGSRSKAVKEYQELGYEDWKDLNKYGLRWLASEGIFSAEKRTFGESVAAKTKENQFFEVKLKFWAYQQLRQSAKLA